MRKAKRYVLVILKIITEILGENYLHKLCIEYNFQPFSKDLAKLERLQNIPDLMVMAHF